MIRIIMSLVMVAFIGLSYAQPSFQEGKDFVLVNGEGLKCVRNSVGVTEFFSFGCPWCYKLEAPLKLWQQKKAASITFLKVPVVFRKGWEYYARAYLLIKSMSLGQKVQDELFKAIIEDKKSLDNPDSMVDFFIKKGVSKEYAQSAFGSSPSIEILLQSDALLMSKYKISAIPAFVVDGRYKTDMQMAETPERLFAILDYLLTVAKSNPSGCKS